MNAAQGERDVLVYSVQHRGGSATLFRYDPQTGTTTALYESQTAVHFTLSREGRIAFSTEWNWGNNGEMYLLDALANDATPINFTEIVGMRGYPLSWSPDGRYLAFASWVHGDNRQNGKDLRLYIWNGNTVVDIMPDDWGHVPESYNWVNWSNDGKLLFTVSYARLHVAGQLLDDTFMWDGSRTIVVASKFRAWGRVPFWSPKNELVFRRSANEGVEIITWDGVSYQDGIPVTDSMFIRSPGLGIASEVHWTPEGDMVFMGEMPIDAHTQIYHWDGQTLTNISQNADAHNGGMRWSDEGYWAFVTFFSPEQLVFIRDPANNTLYEGEGQYTPAWSLTEELAFCRYDRAADGGDWRLMVWSEDAIVELALSFQIGAQWLSGQETFCSSG